MIYQSDLENRFEYHPPKDEATRVRHETVRAELLKVAMVIVGATNPGREQSLAVTKLEEAMMWANASIARQP